MPSQHLALHGIFFYRSIIVMSSPPNHHHHIKLSASHSENITTNSSSISHVVGSIDIPLSISSFPGNCPIHCHHFCTCVSLHQKGYNFQGKISLSLSLSVAIYSFLVLFYPKSDKKYLVVLHVNLFVVKYFRGCLARLSKFNYNGII